MVTGGARGIGAAALLDDLLNKPLKLPFSMFRKTKDHRSLMA